MSDRGQHVVGDGHPPSMPPMPALPVARPADPEATKMLMNCAAMALGFVVLPGNWPAFSAWLSGDETPPVTNEAMREVFMTCWQKMNSAAAT
jgi:hypothetical protein